MAIITGLKSLERKVAAMKAKAAHGTVGGKASVVVGFTAKYAIYVHENLEVYHPNGAPKYLEIPFRQMAPDVPRRLAELIRAGATLPKALLVIGLQLQREAQRLVPVDTGNLRGSAFTRVEGENGVGG